MGLESLDSFLTEYDARSGEEGFDSGQFTNDFQKGVSTTGFNKVQPEPAGGVNDKGFLRETAEAVAGGVSDAAELYMRAVRTIDPEGGNDVIRDLATSGINAIKNFTARHPSLAPSPEVEEGIKRWWVEGVRSFVPSLSAALPGVIAGGVVGGPAGAVVGSTFGGAIFGLAEHDRFKEEVETFITDNSLSEEDAVDLREKAAAPAIYSAITEGGLEGAANALEALSLGLFRPVRRTIKGIAAQPIRQLFKKSAGQIAKEAAIKLPRTAAIEVGTEVSQAALQTKFRRDIGLTDLSSMDAAMSVIGPSLVTTLLFMGASGGANSLQRAGIRKAIEDAKVNPNKRRQAINEISEIVRATGQPESEAIADQLKAAGDRFVDEGISIDLNTEIGVQNSLGEIIKGLRLGETSLDTTKKYAEQLAEGLRSEELIGSERIKATQLLQGITSINNIFSDLEQVEVKPEVKTRPATASDKLRDLGEAATIRGKAPIVRETVEEPISASEALEDLAAEVTGGIQADIAGRVQEPELTSDELAEREGEAAVQEERKRVLEEVEAPGEPTPLEPRVAEFKLPEATKERQKAQREGLVEPSKRVSPADKKKLLKDLKNLQEDIAKTPEGEVVEIEQLAPQAVVDRIREQIAEDATKEDFDNLLADLDEQVRLEDVGTQGVQVPVADIQEDLAEVKTPVDQAAQEAATSITNDIPQPSQAQIEAGNYKKGSVSIHGLDLSVENPKGSERSGFTQEGEPWTIIAVHHYGYIKGTVGRDKDHLDAFIGENPDSQNVFVVNQVDPDTGKFDEHKVMIGFDNQRQAKRGYLANYQKGWKGIGNIIPLSMEEFKTWIKGDTTKELKVDKKPTKREVKAAPVAKKAKKVSKKEVAEKPAEPKITDTPITTPLNVEAELAKAEKELRDAGVVFVKASTKGKAKRDLKKKIQELTTRRDELKEKIATKDELNPVEQAKKNITDKMNRLSLGADPTIIKDLGVVGSHHFKSGLKTFASWSRAMLNDLGSAVKTFLRRVWRTVRRGGIATDETTKYQAKLNEFAETDIDEKQSQADQIKDIKEVKAITDTGKETPSVIDQLNSFLTHNEATVLSNKESRDQIKKNFPTITDEDIKWHQRLGMLPHSKAKIIEEWKKGLGIQIKRMEEKNLLDAKFNGRKFNREDVKEGTKSDRNEVYGLDKEEEQRVLAIVTEGDARGVNGVEFTNEQLRDPAGIEPVEMNKISNNFKDMGKIVLTEKEIVAYRAFQVTTKQVFREILENISNLDYKPFQNEPWVGDLKKVVAKKSEQVKPAQAEVDFASAPDEDLIAPELSATDIPKGLNAKEKAAFTKAYNEIIKPQGRIQELRREVGTRKGYFPHMRTEGTIKVSFVDKDDNVFDSNIFVRDGKANKWITERRAFWKEKGGKGAEDKDFTVKKDTVARTPESVYQDVSAVAIERFMNKTVDRLKTSREGDTPGKITGSDLNDIKEAMASELSRALKGRGFGGAFIARSKGPNIAGYRIDSLKDILAGYVSGATGFITKMEAAYEHGQLMGSIDLKKKPKLYEDLSIYGRNMFRNLTRSDMISSRIRSMAFIWYLSGQFKSPAVNFTQNYILGIPELAKFTTGARRKYHKSMLDISTNNLSDVERKWMVQAIQRGITGDQLMQDILGQVSVNTNKTLMKTVNVLSFMFSQSEILNRKFAWLARFRAGIEKGETGQQAFDGARDFVEDVHFLYGKLNQPIITTGGTPFSNVIRTSLTFRMYTFSFMNAMRNHLSDRNFMLIGRSMAYMALLGGLSSLPFLDDFLDMWERFTGIPIRKKIQQELKGIGGDVLAVVGTQGLPALLGVDISGSLRIHLPDPTDPAQLFQETAFGVYGGLGVKLNDTFKSILDGQALKALEHVSPVFIEKPLKALRVSRDGRVTTKTGKTIFTDTGRALKMSKLEATVQAIGFRPSKLAFESGKFRQFVNVEANFQRRRNSLFRRLRFAKTTEDRQDVLKAIREYNNEARKMRGAIPLITSKTLRKTLKETPSKRFRLFSRT